MTTCPKCGAPLVDKHGGMGYFKCGTTLADLTNNLVRGDVCYCTEIAKLQEVVEFFSKNVHCKCGCPWNDADCPLDYKDVPGKCPETIRSFWWPDRKAVPK